ncbi:hypothetical protein STEG23_032041 [Scotinomys teguina]
MSQRYYGRFGRGRGRDFAGRPPPKKKVPNHVPERWKDYLPVGQRMTGTRFIAFKVPLQKKFEAMLMPEECFSPLDLFNKIHEQNEELGLIIDLTYTHRYYKAEDLPETISYIKIFTIGHQIPSNNTIFKFKCAVKEFLKNNKDNDKLIGVHCTHGLNRTGYLICRYLIDVEGMRPDDAIELFNSCRGHCIERQNYIENLKKRYVRKNQNVSTSRSGGLEDSAHLMEHIHSTNKPVIQGPWSRPPPPRRFHTQTQNSQQAFRKFSQNPSVYKRGLIPPPGPPGEDYSQRRFFWNVKPNGSQATQNKKWTSGLKEGVQAGIAVSPGCRDLRPRKKSPMAPYHIRQYQDSDHKSVLDVFTRGMEEHIPTTFRHVLMLPQTLLLLLGVPLATVLLSGSWLLAIMCIFFLLLLLQLLARQPWKEYVAKCLHTDMADITKSYLNARGSCFWVAESGGQVVGIVGCLPVKDPPLGRKQLELLHLSVSSHHRGQGIAKALVRTVLQFARDQGYSDVVLDTSALQQGAEALYLSMGFRRTGRYFMRLKEGVQAGIAVSPGCRDLRPRKKSPMAPYHIRQYQDSDHKSVLDVFTRGMEEHIPTTFRHVLMLPQTLLLLLGVPLATVLLSGSWLLAIMCIFFLLLLLQLLARQPWKEYVAKCLHTDMADITKSYLNARGSCFWVAESGGQVVGIVGCLPVKDPPLGRKQLELLHLSVSSHHRGQGIAKALVRTVLQFARDQGYSDVVLDTSVLQQGAEALYLSMGFRRTGRYFMSLFGVTGSEVLTPEVVFKTPDIKTRQGTGAFYV